MSGLLVHSGRLVTAGADGSARDEPVSWVRIRDGLVTATGTTDDWTADGDEIVDARVYGGRNAIITPGLVDIHNHGAATFSYDGTPDEIVQAVDAHARHGVTRIVLSLVSAPVDVLEAQLKRILGVSRGHAGILGAHLEGPFIDSDHRGAHDPAALRSPEPENLGRLLATGIVQQVTLAPELEGGLEAIRQVVAAGAVSAIGHTGADAATTVRAIDAGATLLTHAFNAMPPLHHRAPGPIGVAATDDRVVLEVIADGHHIDPRVIQMLFASSPGRLALISDAMAGAAAADGRYNLGTQKVTVTNGYAVLDGTKTLAGSTLTLDRALRNVVSWGIPLATAVVSATAVPARAIGRSDLGRIDEHCRGDLVIWDDHLTPRAAWRDGDQVIDVGPVDRLKTASDETPVAVL